MNAKRKIKKKGIDYRKYIFELLKPGSCLRSIEKGSNRHRKLLLEMYLLDGERLDFITRISLAENCRFCALFNRI